jgi:hypothetical protein
MLALILLLGQRPSVVQRCKFASLLYIIGSEMANTSPPAEWFKIIKIHGMLQETSQQCQRPNFLEVLPRVNLRQ